MFFLTACYILLSVSSPSDTADAEAPQNTSAPVAVPPQVSNSVYLKSAKVQFQDPPFRDCGKDGVYKQGRCEPKPGEIKESPQTQEENS
jgi:hypothetical protein